MIDFKTAILLIYVTKNSTNILIPDNIIKVGIHISGEVSKIYNLDDLEDRVLDTGVVSPQSEENYTVRFWISKNTIATENDMHFHGMLLVEEIN